MAKIVINDCFGGFSLSYEGVMRYAEIKGIKLYAYVPKRDDKGDRIYGYYVPYVPGTREFIISYSTKPAVDGKLPDKDYFSSRDIERDDPALVQTVQELGAQADGNCASLAIVEIPDGVEWQIEEYDGNEHVAEKHRTWGG